MTLQSAHAKILPNLWEQAAGAPISRTVCRSPYAAILRRIQPQTIRAGKERIFTMSIPNSISKIIRNMSRQQHYRQAAHEVDAQRIRFLLTMPSTCDGPISALRQPE